MKNLDYREATQSDLSMLKGWLSLPHVIKWFHGAGLQNAIDGLHDFVAHNSAIGSYWVAETGGIPFALLITSYADSADAHYDAISFAGEKIVTLDLLIGPEGFLGKGYGSILIYDFLKRQFSDATDFVIDPEVANARAVRVYEKIGFVVKKEFIASWHPVPHYLMHVSAGDLIVQTKEIVNE